MNKQQTNLINDEIIYSSPWKLISNTKFVEKSSSSILWLTVRRIDIRFESGYFSSKTKNIKRKHEFSNHIDGIELKLIQI